MKVINLFGGAGIGKSTFAAALFAHMKQLHLNVELVQEYAKDLVYQEATGKTWNNQLDILSNQYKRLYYLNGKVDYAIVDSPLLNSIIYRPGTFPDSLDVVTHDLFNQFNNYNFLMQRTHRYVEHGRIHSEVESLKIDEEIELLLWNYYDYYVVPVGDIEMQCHTVLTKIGVYEA